MTSMKNEDIYLNPFVYISETDIRYYLIVLIGIVFPSFYIFKFSVYDVLDEELSLNPDIKLVSIVFSISITIFIMFLIYLDYKRSPKKIIKESKLKELDKNKYPEQYECIEMLHDEYLSGEVKPMLMVQPRDPSKSARTFGAKNQTYIGIPGGLIKKFRENPNGFKSILLHEMAHIANKDIEKTYIANSTWRVIKLIFIIPLLISFLWLLFNYEYLLKKYPIIILRLTIGDWLELFGSTIIFFIFFIIIIYIIRNQIIRVREFYADAKVLEWKRSPDEMIKTLDESRGERSLKFYILTRVHPNNSERIKVLKNNVSLFYPSIWVALSIGFFYGLIEFITGSISNFFGSTDPSKFPLRLAFIFIFIIPFMMIVFSSSIHKLILNDIIINNASYLSISTILNILKISLAFSFGWGISMDFLNLEGGFSYIYEFLYYFPEFYDTWIYFSFQFFLILIFLCIFCSMLIKRSFSKKEAERNFYISSLFSTILYILNIYLGTEYAGSETLPILFILTFSAIVYIYIKIKDRRLCCPKCNSKLSNLSRFKIYCPNCNNNLYEWAIYPFPKMHST